MKKSNIKGIMLSVAMMATLPAMADSVVFEETFDGDWSESFPTVIDADHLMPAYNIQPIFQNSDGRSMPWWPVKDSNTSSDRFLASHAIYTPEGQSSDWIVSRAIDIPSTGFSLSFEAQSLPFRTDMSCWDSDLHVYVSPFTIDAEDLPDADDATMVITNVPIGEKDYEAEGDFTTYTVNLDKYAGKKIWIAFANLNNNRDLLLLNNIRVSRPDDANLSVTCPEMVVGGNNTVYATVSANSALPEWSVKLQDGEGTLIDEYKGSAMGAGESRDFEFEWNIPADKVSQWVATLEIPGAKEVTQSGTVTALTFEPMHRVLVEEATGMWCSNCPLGMYNIDGLTEHEMTKDICVPVSIHIPGGGIDDLVNTTYAGMVGLTAAPSYRLDREMTQRYFSTNYDVQFNPERNGSMAKLVYDTHKQLTTLDLELKAEYANEEQTSVRVEATVTPALSRKGANLRVGFILKENNVSGDGSPWMVQENATSGNNIEGYLGGWTLLPHKVLDIKYHDVARAIWNYNGIDNSLPSTLTADKAVTYSTTLPVPDTYKSRDFNGVAMVSNPAIKPENVVMVAFVVDLDTMKCLNSVEYPMSQSALERDMAWLSAGVEDIFEAESADNGVVEYFDLQGRKISNPSAGIYIRRQGNKSSKIIIR